MLLLQAVSESFRGTEDAVTAAVRWLRLAVEAIGAAIIVTGVAVGVVGFVRASLHGRTDGYNDVRLRLARFLAVALEFQLGADLLSTAIAPTWTSIGQLAATATLRTALNYFLGREMQEEANRVAESGGTRSAQARALGVAKRVGMADTGPAQ